MTLNLNAAPTNRGTTALAVVLMFMLMFAPVSMGQAQTPVRDVDNPTKQPFQARVENTVLVDNVRNTIPLVSVPAGKRLVIEHVSIRAYGAIAVPALILASLETTVGGLVGEHELILTRAENSFDPPRASVFLVNQSLRAYADPGSVASLKVELISDPGGDAVIRRLTASGHFVDLE